VTVRYDLVWSPDAMDQVARLAKRFPEAPSLIVPAVYELIDRPRPPGSTQLSGSGTYRRPLLGHYRVTYSVSDDPPQITIILVGRSDIPR
jgi:mRNA-degrading endonuclease RelE of RelBE toxin-antitoxin system